MNQIMKIAVKSFFGMPFVSDKTIGDKNALEIVRLYNKGEYAGLSSKIRFWDAPLQELEKRVPKKGTILDLGCGEGVFTNYLGLCSKSRKVIGIEFNKHRVKVADHGVKNVKFLYADVLKKTFPKSDCVVMSHMLHHLPSREDQIRLIKNCYKSLGKRGVLVVAEVDKNWFNWKYLLGWVTDVVIVPILFEKQIYDTNIHHRSKNVWKKVLEEEGFKLQKIDSILGGPFPDIIMVAQKK